MSGRHRAWYRLSNSMGVVVVALACSGDPLAVDTAVDTGTDTTSESDSTSTTTPEPTPTSGPDWDAGDDWGPEEGVPCDPYFPLCLEGEKCVPFGLGWWTDHKCVSVMGTGMPGDVCTSTGPRDAHDDCGPESYCWPSSADSISDGYDGVCLELCLGSPAAPLCAEGASCLVSYAICLPTCDPILQDCGDTQGCYFLTDTFNCIFGATDTALGEGEACTYVNECEPGLQCSSADDLPGCAEPACCAELCDLDNPTCTTAGTVCSPHFMDTAGYEHVGICIPA